MALIPYLDNDDYKPDHDELLTPCSKLQDEVTDANSFLDRMEIPTNFPLMQRIMLALGYSVGE